LPKLAEGIRTIDAAYQTPNESAVLREVFPTLPSISVDHGIMEKAEDLAVVPGDFGWNDVGSWQSAWELGDADASGNRLDSNAVAIDATCNLVRVLGAKRKVVALVGVDNLVVVDTDDVLLVMPRERAQDVRMVIEALKATGRNDVL